MKIGLDFDDVTVNSFDSILEWHNKKYKRNDKREQFKQYAWWQIWGTSREEAVSRVDEFLEFHKVNDVLPVKDAITSMNKLLKDNELIVITARPKKFEKRVEEWLRYHLKRKIKIIHAGDFHEGQGVTKAEICLELGISVLIEDAPKTALECAGKGIRVLLFDTPWNQGISHKNIVRVRNWDEIMDRIK